MSDSRETGGSASSMDEVEWLRTKLAFAEGILEGHADAPCIRTLAGNPPEEDCWCFTCASRRYVQMRDDAERGREDAGASEGDVALNAAIGARLRRIAGGHPDALPTAATPGTTITTAQNALDIAARGGPDDAQLHVPELEGDS